MKKGNKCRMILLKYYYCQITIVNTNVEMFCNGNILISKRSQIQWRNSMYAYRKKTEIIYFLYLSWDDMIRSVSSPFYTWKICWEAIKKKLLVSIQENITTCDKKHGLKPWYNPCYNQLYPGVFYSKRDLKSVTQVENLHATSKMHFYCKIFYFQLDIISMKCQFLNIFCFYKPF